LRIKEPICRIRVLLLVLCVFCDGRVVCGGRVVVVVGVAEAGGDFRGQDGAEVLHGLAAPNEVDDEVIAGIGVVFEVAEGFAVADVVEGLEGAVAVGAFERVLLLAAGVAAPTQVVFVAGATAELEEGVHVAAEAFDLGEAFAGLAAERHGGGDEAACGGVPGPGGVDFFEEFELAGREAVMEEGGAVEAAGIEEAGVPGAGGGGGGAGAAVAAEGGLEFGEGRGVAAAGGWARGVVEDVRGEEVVELLAQPHEEADDGLGGAQDVPPFARGEAGGVADEAVEGVEGEVELVGDLARGFEGRFEESGDLMKVGFEDGLGEGAAEFALGVGGEAAADVFAFGGGDLAGGGPFADDHPIGLEDAAGGGVDGFGEARGREADHGWTSRKEKGQRKKEEGKEPFAKRGSWPSVFPPFMLDTLYRIKGDLSSKIEK
jgi:hypothetical protein